jgi:hypothetical protein
MSVGANITDHIADVQQVTSKAMCIPSLHAHTMAETGMSELDV